MRVAGMGADATCALMLAASRQIAKLLPKSSPHEPSSAKPPHEKPSKPKRGRRKPGARPGHSGSRRAQPTRIDREVMLPDLTQCPRCRGAVQPARTRRERIIEDMLENLRAEATRYSIPRQWCPCCRKHVEPRVAAALPYAVIGNRIAAMTAVFHYGLGLTIEQTREVLLSPLQTKISAGGLVDLWQRLARTLAPWYDQIAVDARASASLHADETGWRVDGATYWLWCFTNRENCWYMIDRSRGSPAIQRFFIDAFEGVLIHDFWRPYSSIVLAHTGDHQCCLVHLLRELSHVTKHCPKAGEAEQAWSSFAKRLKRLIKDAVRLRAQPDFEPAAHQSRILRINDRLQAIAYEEHADADASRLAARLRRHESEIFTFLDVPEADWNNNFAERQIRPAVVLRKGSQCNRSEQGAATQAVLMSIYRTLKLRGHDPRAAITDALNSYAGTGSLPPLPKPVAGG